MSLKKNKNDLWIIPFPKLGKVSKIPNINNKKI